jgi:hypothetical protein
MIILAKSTRYPTPMRSLLRATCNNHESVITYHVVNVAI